MSSSKAFAACSEPCDSSGHDGKRRGDRGRTGRAHRGTLAAVAGIRADDLRAESDAGRSVDGAGRRQRHMADHAHQHQPDPHGLQRPGARERSGLPVEPRHSRLPASLCGDIRPDVAHPIRHSGRTPQPRRWRMARPAFRHDRDLRTSGGGQRQVPITLHPKRSRTRHFHRRGRSELHVRLPRSTSLPRQARSRRGRCHQRARDRCRARAARRGARRGDPAPTALRPAEIRRGSAVRPSDLHAVRNPRERNSARSRDRPTAQGDRRRSRWKPGTVRSAGARPVAVRRRRHPGPAVPAARSRGSNHGAAVDDIQSRARP